MTNPPKPPFDLPPAAGEHDPLTRQALAWLVHLHSGQEKPEDWAAFEDWQAASADHRRAGEAAKRLWEQLGPALLRDRKSWKRSTSVLLAAAVGLGAIAFAAGLFGPPASFFADYRSTTGEVRSVTLRDGSQVDLDTGTSFDVSDDDRTVTLHTGQIFVTVKPNPERPFVVIAGNGRVRALGTAFAVRRDGAFATVVVTESAVRVDLTRGTRTGSAQVAAGQAISFSPRSVLGTPHSANVASLTAWRRGELVFDGRPLREVVTELGRYRIGRILIFDTGVAELPVTGNIEIADTDAFLDSLQLALPVTVIRMPGLALILRDSTRPMPSR